MGTGYYILIGFVLLVGLAGVIAQVMRISEDSAKNSKKELLKKMLKNRDIDSDIYVKYSNDDE